MRKVREGERLSSIERECRCSRCKKVWWSRNKDIKDKELCPYCGRKVNVITRGRKKVV